VHEGHWLVSPHNERKQTRLSLRRPFATQAGGEVRVHEEVNQGHLVGQGRGHRVGPQFIYLLLSTVTGTPADQIRLEIHFDFAQLVELLTPSVTLARG
jgi:hypothetical protein